MLGGFEDKKMLLGANLGKAGGPFDFTDRPSMSRPVVVVGVYIYTATRYSAMILWRKQLSRDSYMSSIVEPAIGLTVHFFYVCLCLSRIIFDLFSCLPLLSWSFFLFPTCIPVGRNKSVQRKPDWRQKLGAYYLSVILPDRANYWFWEWHTIK